MRRLPSIAVIPDELYVERNADRQLVGAILDMGRPAYILDPRQMGKTNLLLHARRRLENDALRFVYLDLSMGAESAAAFYRRVVETTALSHPDLVGSDLLAVALGSLEDGGPDPSSAFERFLVGLLADWTGRLVIVLDEVDGLTGRAFSDRVFAHIRSLYFSRDSQPELRRITFVLAGVAEPSQLIRDRTISPFNIGQKIYLQDFTVAQVAELAARAGLGFSEAVCERIVHWTSGTPRLTWDLASDLELLEQAGDLLDRAKVDSVVRERYLSTFDRPPVDHVRTLVEASPPLRMAASALRRGDPLTDRQRASLYLAGVATLGTGDAPSSFRNRIIDRALSQRWLAEVDAATGQDLIAAQIAFRARDFATAAEAYRRYFDGRGWTASDRGDVLWIVVSHYELGQLETALEQLAVFDALGDADALGSLWRARVLLGLGRMPEAERAFAEALEGAPDPVTAGQAQLGLARAALGDPRRRDEAERLARAALAAFDAAARPGAVPPRDVALAVETLARVSPPGEQARMLRGLAHGTDAPSASILALVAMKEPDPAERLAAIRRALSELRPGPQWLADVGTVAGAFRADGSSRDLREALRGLVEATGIGVGDLYGTAFNGLVATGWHDASRTLAVDMADDALRGDLDPEIALHACRTVLLLQKSVRGLGRSYVELVGRHPGCLTKRDHFALLSVYTDLQDKGEFDGELRRIYAELRPPSDPRLRQSFLLIRFIQVLACLREGDVERGARLAYEARRLVDEVHATPKDRRELPPQMLDLVTSVLDRVQGGRPAARPSKNALRRIGRNDGVSVRYRDGRVVSGKFKTFRNDLEHGSCVLVEDVRAPAAG